MTEKREFKCDICKKTFGQMNDLENTFYMFMTKRKTGSVKFVTIDFLKKRIKHAL